jgi:hypothetical protein
VETELKDKDVAGMPGSDRKAHGCIIHSDRAYVAGRLDELGLSETILRESLSAAYESSALLSENFPPMARGLWVWFSAHASLRDRVLPRGWAKDDARNFSTVVDPTGQYALAVATGNGHTGDKDRRPSTRHDKGAVTFDAVAGNRQRQLADYVPEFGRVRQDLATQETWFLLHFQHHDKEADRDEIRAELSLPASIGTDGYIDEWRERIILERIPLGHAAIVDPIVETPQEDVPVQYKKRR